MIIFIIHIRANGHETAMYDCSKGLRGRQKKYCSRGCKSSVLNLHFQSYVAQQRRGRERKLELIRLLDGRCENCGCDKNYSALESHHAKPAEKSYQLDLRALSNRKWEAILEEVKKCRLLCSHRHAEEHNPDCLITN